MTKPHDRLCLIKKLGLFYLTMNICWSSVQTLELVHQERVSLSAKLVEKSTYYAKVAEDIHVNFQQLQGWLNCRIPSSDTEVRDLVKETMDEEKVAAGAHHHLFMNTNGASATPINADEAVN
ncbi:uncharacterized protein LOC115732417 isoform X2 [Rhodamnia argentea]|uniref:Uncharacterized protein LOC115732417 isoform X2 n=1 Tax=Rhodamnia argentea TaxID=178133 RepID=A0ABM3H0N7_9MYRT|nr:uncharacterized protein LOC115732417 isoform X2 [Rhodamnia argentea]